MTTFWISQPKHWCETCRTWCDGKKSQIQKHERGEKHQRNVEMAIKRKRREKWLKEKEDAIALRELRRIEDAALLSFNQDREQGITGAKNLDMNRMK